MEVETAQSNSSRIRSAFRELDGVDVRTMFARQGVIPRMLLHRKPCAMVQRVGKFSSNQWLELIRICVGNEKEPSNLATSFDKTRATWN